MTSALLVAVLADVVLGLLIVAALLGVGYPTSGALVFGASVGVTGLVFAGVTSVTAQLTERSRVVGGLAGLVLALAWTVRAAGALQGDGTGVLTWLSPLAWAQLTRPLDHERWWPLGLTIVLSAVTVAAAYALSARRDVGAGLLPSRPGPATAVRWLRSPVALAVRTQGRGILWWALALVLVGLVYGGLSGSVDGVGDDMATSLFGSDAEVVDVYLSLMVALVAFLVAIVGILVVQSVRRDEAGGLAEAVLATATGRVTWLGSSLLVAGVAAVALLASSGLAMGVGAALSMGEPFRVGQLTAAALAHLPEVWLLLALATVIYGLAPRLLWLSWAMLAFGGVQRVFGSQQWPDWLTTLSPLHYTPRMPLDGFTLPPLLVLGVVAAALIVVGLAAFRRRDLASG